jgi:hypothetical protein
MFNGIRRFHSARPGSDPVSAWSPSSFAMVTEPVLKACEIFMLVPLYQEEALPSRTTVSAILAPRLPSGFGCPVVLSRTV